MQRIHWMAMIGLTVYGCAGVTRIQGTSVEGRDPLLGVSAKTLHERAQRFADAGDYMRAEQYFAAAVKRGYPESEVVPSLVEVCIEASRIRAALGYAEPYLERHADDWALRYLVASLYFAMNDTERSADHLEQVVQLRPDWHVPHYLLGVLLGEHLGQPTRARRHLRAYLRAAPKGRYAAHARQSLAVHARRPRQTKKTTWAGNSSRLRTDNRL